MHLPQFSQKSALKETGTCRGPIRFHPIPGFPAANDSVEVQSLNTTGKFIMTQPASLASV